MMRTKLQKKDALKLLIYENFREILEKQDHSALVIFFGIFLHNSKYVIGHVTKGIKLYLDNTQLDRVKTVWIMYFLRVRMK